MIITQKSIYNHFFDKCDDFQVTQDPLENKILAPVQLVGDLRKAEAVDPESGYDLPRGYRPG
jgi:hypothetical protein